MQDSGANSFRFFRPDHSSLPLPLAFAPQQLAIDLGDLFQVVFQFVVVFNPAANLVHILLAYDAPRGAALSQGDRQIPYWPVTFATRALAGWIATGDVSFDQGPT